MTAATKPQAMPVADAQAGGPARRRPVARRGDGDRHGNGGGEPGGPPGKRLGVLVAAGRRGRAEEDADAGGHRDGGTPLAPAGPAAAGPQHEVAENPQQLDREYRLNEGERAEAQRAHLEHEPGDHAGEAEQPGRLPGQPEHEQRVEAAHLAVVRAARAKPLADRGGGGTQARGECQQDRQFHPRAALLFSRHVRKRDPACERAATASYAGHVPSAAPVNVPWPLMSRGQRSRRDCRSSRRACSSAISAASTAIGDSPASDGRSAALAAAAPGAPDCGSPAAGT